QMNRAGALKGKNSPKQRWQRAAFFARRLQDGNETLDDAGVPHEETGARLKNMETQHWLELIDGKHRYGANREYLSTEQRLNYLVSIDSKGKLRWSKNNELVDTTAGRWKDSGDGAGIVPEDVPVSGTRPAGPTQRTSFSSSASSLSSSDDSAAAHYAGEKKGRNPVSKAFHRYFTLKGIFGKLLRKTIRKNTWIYVTVTHYRQVNILIGIKGMRDGLTERSSQHFEHFLDVLKERGVDMHRAEVSKAYAALWGSVLFPISFCAALTIGQNRTFGQVPEEGEGGGK
ncbi:hypothetical protein CYLTODRAFT_357304, partial [Cylindrobasidium torrendii FP15055 ss-10]